MEAENLDYQKENIRERNYLKSEMDRNQQVFKYLI
jgi:hypothetical protein